MMNDGSWIAMADDSGGTLWHKVSIMPDERGSGMTACLLYFQNNGDVQGTWVVPFTKPTGGRCPICDSK